MKLYTIVLYPSIDFQDLIIMKTIYEDVTKEALHGYVSFRLGEEKTPKVFIFPLSREGFQTVGSKKQLALLLKTKFRQAYSNPEMQCPYQISEVKGSNPMKVQEHKLTAFCKICTNTLIYVKRMFTEYEFKLVKMSGYHVHGKDPHMVEQILRKQHNYARFTCRQGRPFEIKPLYIDQKMETNIQDYIKALPSQITNPVRCRIVCERFKITKIEYQNLMRSIRAEYEISLRELLQRFDKKSFTYRYLPANLLDINEQFIRNKKINEHLQSLKAPDPDKPKNVHEIDITNPDIPNVLLVISPQMKQLYHKYGQYVGFDLTFSLIKEKPLDNKQYLVGVFAGTSQSRRIMVYGLVITNNQSIEVYKFLFRQFLTIMGKNPQTIVTDQQLSLYYALRDLKNEGVFTGNHLLDMFHILKKFRKEAEPNTFQLFRKLMHAKDRIEYRKFLKEAMHEVSNDEELNLLRNFDYNSEKYCFSQSLKGFIGIGISDSMNQKFHDLIKAQLPYESKYIKAVNIILDLIDSRNEMNRYGMIDKNPLEEKMNMPIMKQYRTVLSDKIFHLLLKQVFKSLAYVILTNEQQIVNDCKTQKLQEVTSVKRHYLINKDRYKVKTNLGVFTVYRDHTQQSPINQSKRQSKGKWKCYCQFESKSGFLCSHIIKVLLSIGQDFTDNIHPRWIIRQDQIEQGLKKFIYRQRKFHHYTRVRMRRTPKLSSRQQATERRPQRVKKQLKDIQIQDDEDSQSYEQQFSTSGFNAESNQYRIDTPEAMELEKYD